MFAMALRSAPLVVFSRSQVGSDMTGSANIRCLFFHVPSTQSRPLKPPIPPIPPDPPPLTRSRISDLLLRHPSHLFFSPSFSVCSLWLSLVLHLRDYGLGGPYLFTLLLRSILFNREVYPTMVGVSGSPPSGSSAKSTRSLVCLLKSNICWLGNLGMTHNTALVSQSLFSPLRFMASHQTSSIAGMERPLSRLLLPSVARYHSSSSNQEFNPMDVFLSSLARNRISAF